MKNNRFANVWLSNKSDGTHSCKQLMVLWVLCMKDSGSEDKLALTRFLWAERKTIFQSAEPAGVDWEKAVS
jgi:hypothetical protein